MPIELDIHNPSCFIYNPQKITVPKYIDVIDPFGGTNLISEIIGSLVLYLNQPQDSERQCSRLNFIARKLVTISSMKFSAPS
jgi:hypothetical protein